MPLGHTILDPNKKTLLSIRECSFELGMVGNKNALTLHSLWALVVAIYLMDIHIWYTLILTLVGGMRSVRARLGEIHTIEMLCKHFESFPEAFTKNLVLSQMTVLAVYIFLYGRVYLAVSRLD